MLKKVKLYGELAEKFGKEWSLDINSPAEAIRALCANNADFRPFVANSEQRGVGYKVVVGEESLKDVANELAYPTGRQEIKIIPVVLGAKRGIGQVIVGALMIYAAVMTAGATTIAAAEGAALAAGNQAAAGTIGSIGMGTQFTIGMGNLSGFTLTAAKFGAALVLGGVASMLAPTPTNAEAESNENYSFNGAANTTRQGVAIPICYGQLIVGGAVISAGVEPEDYTP